MRFVLRQGTREVLIFSRNRLGRFEDVGSATRFLTGQLQDARNLDRLRDALKESSSHAHFAAAEPVKLVSQLAGLMAQGDLALLFDPDALAPWSWPFALTPSFPDFDGGAEAESNPLATLVDAAGELLQELEEVLPLPVIPPIFPQIARIEAAAINFETRLFSIALDLLRFIGVPVLDASDVAPTLSKLAQGAGNALKDTVGGFVSNLFAMLSGDPEKFGDSELGLATRGVAEMGGMAVKNAAGAAFSTLMGIATGSDFGPSPTSVGEAFRILAGGAKEAMHLGVNNTVADLRPLMGGGASAQYGFGGGPQGSALQDFEDKPVDTSAALDNPLWLTAAYTGEAGSPQKPAPGASPGTEVVCLVSAKGLPVGEFVHFTVLDALGRTLGDRKVVWGTGGPNGLTQFRWRVPGDLAPPKGLETLEVVFIAKVESQPGNLQSAPLVLTFGKAEDLPAVMAEPKWLAHPSFLLKGQKADQPTALAAYGSVVKMQVKLTAFRPGERLRFELHHPESEHALFTQDMAVSKPDELLTAEVELLDLPPLDAKKPMGAVVFRVVSTARTLAVTSLPLQVMAPFAFSDSPRAQKVDTKAVPRLSDPKWTDADGNPVVGLEQGKAITLYAQVAQAHLEKGTKVSIEVRDPDTDALVAMLDAKVDGARVRVAYALPDGPAPGQALIFKASVAGKVNPVASAAVRSAAWFRFSDGD